MKWLQLNVFLSIIWILSTGCDNKSKSTAEDRAYDGFETLTQVSGLSFDEVEKNGVLINFRLFKDKSDGYWIGIHLKPKDSGFHLYGMSLDPIKTEGIGIATKFTLLKGNPISIEGSIQSSIQEETISNEVLNISYPLYPESLEGITLVYPIKFLQGEGNISSTISYMACKTSGVCLDPVRDFPLSVSYKIDAISHQ